MSTGGCTLVPKPHAPKPRFDQRPYPVKQQAVSLCSSARLREGGHLDLNLMPQLAGSIIAPQDQQRAHALTVITYLSPTT